MISLGFLVALGVVTVGAPLIAPHSPIEIVPAEALRPPSPQYWMGTDAFGRDILSRVIHGGQISLQIAGGAVLMAAIPGVLIGVVAGYRGGWVDDVIMRFTDVLLAFPGILLAMGIVTVLRPGLVSLIIAVGISSIPHFARVTRGSTLSVAQNQYIEAARVNGCSDARIMALHILPNVAAPIIVLSTLAIGTSILTAAALSFLGLGPQPPAPEWGAMLNAGRDYLRQAPWVMTFPGLAITATVLSVNLLGDGLRDAFDPRLRSA